MLALGRPMVEVMHEQTRAFRAQSFQKNGGRWVNADDPPHVSMRISLLSRRPSKLHMRLPLPKMRWGSMLCLLCGGLYMRTVGWRSALQLLHRADTTGPLRAGAAAALRFQSESRWHWRGGWLPAVHSWCGHGAWRRPASGCARPG